MATSIETHGLDCGPFERFEEEFIACLACGGRFDPTDWDDTPGLFPSSTDVPLPVEQPCADAPKTHLIRCGGE